jgi:AcrR family transcriptional regulator
VTSLDDVMDRAGVSKSQVYHYFEDRAALLRAVIDHNTEGVIRYLGAVDDSWIAIRAWLDSMVDLQVERKACGGCPVGSLVRSFRGSTRRRGSRPRTPSGERQAGSARRSGMSSRRRRWPPSRTVCSDPDQTRARQLAIALDAAYAHLRAHVAGPRL